MDNEKEKIVSETLVGASEKQSIQSNNNTSIADNDNEINTFVEEDEGFEREMRLELMPGYLKTVSMPELYDSSFESQPPLIDGLIHRGTYLFAGAPKVGKSFLMAQIAYHVGTGLPLWGYQVRKCPVLYFALEDHYQRLQQRLYKMFGAESAADLYFATACRTVEGGLSEQIQGFMLSHPSTGLIIIDTLKRVRESSRGDFGYANDYDIVARLKSIADSYGITMLIVHHTRKQSADDRFDTISGTNGLLGAADGAMILSKKQRIDNECVLEITGRDQQDQKIHLVRNAEKLSWDFLNAETELWKHPPDPLLEKVSDFLFSVGDMWVGTATELCVLLQESIQPNVLSLKLNINSDALMKEHNIVYQSKRIHEGRKILLKREKSVPA